MSNNSVVDRYGWEDNRATHAHGFIAPSLIKMAKNINANRILDLGCGNGALTHQFSDAGFNIVGCDADEQGIQQARQLGGEFKQVSIYDDPEKLEANDFDLVVSAEVIEHLFTPKSLPRFAHAVLKDNGYLLITTPYHGYFKNLVLSLLNKWDNHLDPFWDGGHIKFWSRNTLGKLLKQEGFEVLDFKGVGRFPYLWKSMILLARKVN